MRLFFSLFLLVFFFGQRASAQSVAYPQLKLTGTHKLLPLHTGNTPALPLLKTDSATVLPVQSRLPLNFYSQHLGAACKMELQLEKQTKLPIRIRLGSKEQVDYLEGKFSRNR